MESSDTSTWRVELLDKFSIKDAEDKTRTAFTTGKIVFKETETKIVKLVKSIDTESKDAREKINNGDSRSKTIENLKETFKHTREELENIKRETNERMETITDLIDNDQIIQNMDEEVADEIHDINSKILSEISKKIIQSTHHMNRIEQRLDKERIERKDKLIEKLEEIKNKQSELSEEIKRVEEELKGGERTNNETLSPEKTASKDTDHREKTASKDTDHRESTPSHDKSFLLHNEKEGVKNPNARMSKVIKVLKDVNPVVKNIKEVTPKESTIPDK